MTQEMKVLKRGGRGYEPVKFDKITARIRTLCHGLDPVVDPTLVAKNTIDYIVDGIETEALDQISSSIAESMKLVHPDYSKLAGRILVSNLHKTTPSKFSEFVGVIHANLHVLNDVHVNFILQHAQALDSMIVQGRDYSFDYFVYKTMEGSFLLKISEPVYNSKGLPVYVDEHDQPEDNENVRFTKLGKPYRGENTKLFAKKKTRIVERPQYVYMRVAVGIYMNYPNALELIAKCYNDLSEKYYTHATPTLFNSCGKTQQLNSCFLLGTNDNIEHIMKTASDTSIIGKWAGGNGIHFHNIRSHGSLINSTNGKSSGLPKQLKIYNEIARCWDQGGKRPGAIAAYLEPWHGDIMEFLHLKLNNGKEDERARDLFYALWIPDLFYKRVKDDQNWSLFSPSDAPGLSDVFDGMLMCTECGYCDNSDYNSLVKRVKEPLSSILGDLLRAGNEACQHNYQARDMFTELYARYEREGLATRTLPARTVQEAIIEMQRESGTPYMLFKDHINRQSNHKNLGTIKSSNLCAEIVQWSSANSYACCCLGSINLPAFLRTEHTPSGDVTTMDYKLLHEKVRNLARNLDGVIDVNTYPVQECVGNAQDYRPIGIGIQGLADVLAIMHVPFLSTTGERLDNAVAETIYHAALTESVAMAQERGAYGAFQSSPASQGVLRFDMWLENQSRVGGAGSVPFSGMYDWQALREQIQTHGIRNSLMVAYMPTVTTSQIMGNNEGFEPFNSNLYTKTTQFGKFTISNNHMIRHLLDLGVWNENLKNRIIVNDGSVQGLAEVPADVQQIYKTVWEMSQKELMRRSSLRSAFIDQSQSLNIYLRDNSSKYLRTVFMLGYEYGLCTGSYYIRSKPATQALKNNISDMKRAEANKHNNVIAPTTSKFGKVVDAIVPAEINFSDSCSSGACSA